MIRTEAKKLLVVIGTRPEAIKLAPVILLAQEQPQQFTVQVVLTGQHREMLDQMLREFGISADRDLAIMRPSQNLSQITTAALDGLYRSFEELQPDIVMVQGDTTTTLAGALAASYHRIAVAHVEAGLRTFDRSQPFPEEINRCLTSQLATFHFAPTVRARDNLLREGIAGDQIWVTGNTAIDALLLTLKRMGADAPSKPLGRMLLVTAHRRENHGAPMQSICAAIVELLERFPDLHVLLPVHLSPQVRSVVMPRLSGHPRIRLSEPLGYADFVVAMSQAYLILTDSGGVQEEAPSLGKPVLVMRETTERPEAIEAGTALLVGTEQGRIVTECARLFADEAHYQRVARIANPYGDGTAARRILRAISGGNRREGDRMA